MKRRLLALCLIPALAGYSQITRAEDGKQLHDANCVSCHKSEVYTRTDRKVHSLEELGAQVIRCESALALSWTQAQHKAVTEYLNSAYYNFSEPKS